MDNEHLPPRRATVRVSAPVGATMEFLAAEAPKARPRVRATRDMVDIMLETGKDRLLRLC